LPRVDNAKKTFADEYRLSEQHKQELKSKR